MKLHIRKEDVSGNVKDAYYDTFRIEDEVCKTPSAIAPLCITLKIRIWVVVYLKFINFFPSTYQKEKKIFYFILFYATF